MQTASVEKYLYNQNSLKILKVNSSQNENTNDDCNEIETNQTWPQQSFTFTPNN